MDVLFSRYRNLTVLVVAILSQLVLLAYQVKSNQDVRLIRVWAVTAVTPLARVVEGVRGNTIGTLKDYFVLVGVRDENQRLKSELGRLKLENQYLKTELATADRAQALSAFQSRSPSKTIAARIIGAGTGTNAKVVFLDRGSTSGVLKGMAVVTPDGIVGKVLASYPTAAQVLLITDPTFAAGVISSKNRVHGTLKGQGHSTCLVDYVQNEEKVEVGEWFYTSGDDRVFPKGLPVGEVKVVRAGKGTFKEIFLAPSGFQTGLEEVLIVLEGVHQQLPEGQAAGQQPMRLLPAPPGEGAGGEAATQQPQATASGLSTAAITTEADRMRERYKKMGESQNHVFGQGLPGSKPPNFNLEPTPPKTAAPAPGGQPVIPSRPSTPPAQPPAAPASKPVPDPTRNSAPPQPR